MPDARIDFNVNDRLSAVDAFVDRLRTIEHCKAGDHYCVDLSRCEYLGPDAASILGVVFLNARRLGVDIKLIPPNGPQALRQFWNSSGLAHLIAHGTCLANEDPQSAVVPLSQYRTAGFNDADRIIRLVHRFTEMSSDNEEYLRICVNEVVQNVQDHSGSVIGCVMSARFMISRGEVRVAIVDHGVGICSSLQKRFPDTTPSLALKRVTQGHYSAMSRVNNMGLGISNLCGIIDALGGDIFILSEKAAAVKHSNRAWDIREHSFDFEGTGVFFTLPVGV